MGTCISKCMPNSSTTRQPCVPQDKLVVSQSPCVATSVQVSDGHQYSSSISSSSSSSTTSISSSICASSCSSSLTSSSRDGCPRSEPLWASARPRHPHIVVLNPGSCKLQSPPRTNPVNLLDHQAAPGAFPKKMADAPGKPQPPKRARSTSPALVRQKSFRRSPEQSSAVLARCQRQSSSPFRPVQARQATETRLPRTTPSPSRPGSSVREFQPNKVSHGSGSLASPSPGRRFDGGAAGERPKCMSEEFPSHELVTGESKTTAAGPLATRKERLSRSTSTSPSVPGRLLHVPRWRRRETSVHPINVAPLEREVAEMISDRDCGLAHMEDMNNPLIALDCFIFL